MTTSSGSMVGGVLTMLIAAGQLPLLADGIGKKEPKPGTTVEVEIAKGVTMKFCWVPQGEAQLGSPEKERRAYLKFSIDLGIVDPDLRKPNYLTQESEDLRGKFETNGFWLGKYEVTQKQWQAITGKNPSLFIPSDEVIKAAGILDTSEFPVHYVSWDDCMDFLKKLNEMVKAPDSMGPGKFAMPRENEWEYACRGGKGNKQAYYCGNELDYKLANCDEETLRLAPEKEKRLGRTAAVGSYEKQAPHPWGLCDMAGNVDELCDDWFDAHGRFRVARGGCWDQPPKLCRSAARDNILQSKSDDRHGLRVIFVSK